MLDTPPPNESLHRGAITSEPVRGRPVQIGTGFSALGFKHDSFDGLMDPLVMVDHFTMSEPTFGPHPHAGMSAVSILFEDSEGRFHNRDSLGNDLDLMPGDLYWLAAGRGAVHDEKPRPGSRTHALQVFVNLPSRCKQQAPDALHVRAADMPVLAADGSSVRIVLGSSNGVQGARSPALPLTILDAHLSAGGRFVHAMPADADAWLLAVGGDAQIAVAASTIALREGFAVAVRSGPTALPLAMTSAGGAHLAMLQGDPIRERFVQRGPFVMSNTAALAAVTAAHAAGRLGSID